MTKVAENRSTSERSSQSHSLLSSEDCDSGWWEQEPITLAGIGPSGVRANIEQNIEQKSDVLNLLGTGTETFGEESDEDENEPTRLLARALLQLPPRDRSDGSQELGSSQPAESELGRPSSGSQVRATLPPAKRAESDLGLERADSSFPPMAAADLDSSPSPLAPGELDELAHRITHQSALSRWMAPSSAGATTPQSPEVARSSRPSSVPTLASTPVALARSLAPLASTIERGVVRLSRSRTFAAFSAAFALALVAAVGFSRFKNAPVTPPPGAAVPAPPLAPGALEEGVTAKNATETSLENQKEGLLEPTKSEPTRSEPTRSEPTRSEPTRSEPTKSEPTKSEPTKSELGEVAAPRVARTRLGARPPSRPTPSATSTTPLAPEQDAGKTIARVKADASPAASGSAILNVNSIPISSIIVDGRAEGSTPRVLQVTPGGHTVVFVHPELGQRTVSIDVTDGTTAVAAVRF